MKITFRYCPFRSPIKPISQSDKAHFMVRYGAFQPSIWAILHSEMVFFAMQRNSP